MPTTKHCKKIQTSNGFRHCHKNLEDSIHVSVLEVEGAITKKKEKKKQEKLSGHYKSYKTRFIFYKLDFIVTFCQVDIIQTP